MSVKVFFASVTSSLQIKKNQQNIFSILTSKKIEYETVDITQDSKSKDLMRDLTNNPQALPPQIFNGEDYCGDYEAFHNAIEAEQLETFLKL